jgi:hypothetical protein
MLLVSHEKPGRPRELGQFPPEDLMAALSLGMNIQRQRCEQRDIYQGLTIQYICRC